MKVAVYGSLKKGFHNDIFLDTSELKGIDETLSEYTMYSMGGSFPCITEEGDTSISIEVYEVDEGVFERLDMLEGYPLFYNRKEIDTKWGQAWIYYVKDKSYLGDLNRVDSGRWE